MIDPQLTGLRLSDISPHRPMRQEGADGLLVGRGLGIAQSQDRGFDPLQGLLPGGFILLGLLGVVNQDEPASSFSLADDDLLDLQVLSHFLVPALERQGFLMSRLAVPQLLAQDVMPAGFLEDDP